MTDELVHVCSVEDLNPGDFTVVLIQDTPVGVLNVDGNFFAIENQCPHQGGPVCTGIVRPVLVGEFIDVGKRVEESMHSERMAVACPWHGWEFDLQSGHHLGDPDFSIATYDVIVDNGEIFIDPLPEE